MDTPIVFATRVTNDTTIPIAKPVPVYVPSIPLPSAPLPSAPPSHMIYDSQPVPSHMNRETTVYYVETNDRSDSLCSFLLCCCLIQNLVDQM